MTSVTEQNKTPVSVADEKSFFGIIIHSFFVIPFVIAVSAVILFAAIHWLTKEQLTAYDYLEQVKTGGITKRWQAAFELSKILANPKLIPSDQRFVDEMQSAFEKAENDDQRIQQYLALAMAKTGNPVFAKTLIQSLREAQDENLYTQIYALGMLKERTSVPTLLQYLDHREARIRSVTVVALGNIGDENIKPALRKMLSDPEPNVQWGAAITLARWHDLSSKKILANLLDRKYLAQFSEVDPSEQTQIIIEALQVSGHLKDPDLLQKFKELSQSDQNMRVRSVALSILQKEVL